MKPVRINDASHIMQSPPGWDEAAYGPCEALAALMAGGCIVVTVFGMRMPPVALHVE